MPASDRSTVVIVATVAAHLKAFHLRWVNVLRAHNLRVVGVARDVSSCAECQSSFDEVHDVPFSRSLTSSTQLLRAGCMLRKVIDACRPSVVHFHTPNAAFFGRMALARNRRSRGFRVLYTAHGFHFHRGGNMLKNRVFRFVEGQAAKWTDAIITINREDFDAAVDLCSGLDTKVYRIPGIGIDTNWFAPAAVRPDEVRDLRTKLGLPVGSNIVAMVAEFSPGKRHQDAVEAIRLVQSDNCLLLLAGIGPEQTRIKSLVAQKKLERRVRFLGFHKDVRTLLAISSVLVLPSEREGLPVCVMEAMAMEKPIVAADARGTKELLSDGCGILHPVGNAQSLSRGLSFFLNHPNDAAVTGQRARKRIEDEYSWPVVRRDLVKIYSMLLPQVAGFKTAS